MKKLLFAFLLACSVSAGAQNFMTVDSIKVLPQNPTPMDSVFLHVYWHCNYGCGLQQPMSVTTAGNSHSVAACYIVGLIAVITSGDDSVFLFQGPPGIHVVGWQVTQNATPQSSCDYYHAQGQTTVNVQQTTGVPEFGSAPLMNWNMPAQQLYCGASGMLRIYSVNGELVRETSVTQGEMLTLDGVAGQLYLATLTKENGEVSTIKFVVH